jgi:predicted metal-binding protein
MNHKPVGEDDIMATKTKVAIIICDRYHTCAGGKCLRALHQRDGAFAAYKDQDVELVGFTTCGGCPGGNIEYAPEEMVKNGAEVVHLATGLLVGYPPCPHLDHFIEMIPKKFGLRVVVGTHPIPQKYWLLHGSLNTWTEPRWDAHLALTRTDEVVRLAYD